MQAGISLENARLFDEKQKYTEKLAEEIAEREKADDKLKESESKHTLLFESMYPGVVYQDGSGVITDANQSAEKILGLTLDQMKGRSSIDPRWKSIHEDGSDFPGETHPVMVSIKTGEPVNNVIMGVYNPSSNEYNWISINSIPQFNPGENKPNRVITTFEDITERRQAEEALKESEERFHYLTNASIEAIFINKNGICLEANQAAADMFGYDHVTDLIGIFGTDVIAPESHQIVKEYMLSNSTDPYEAVGLRKNGTTFPVSIRAKKISFKDQGEVRVTSIHDISHQKEQEIRFQVVAEASSNIIYEWDVVTDDLLWFGDIDAELGYEKGEISQTIAGWVSLIHPEDVAELGKAVEHHRISTSSIIQRYRVKRKDGNWRHWMDRGCPVLNSDNLPTKWIGFCTDVTEQIELEAHFQQAQKMESVGRLAGGVAHDFNNMLGVILGHTDMLLEQTSPDQPIYTSLEEIKNAGERSADLTRQLLAYARRQTVSPKVLDLNQAVEGMLNMLHRLIGEYINLTWQPGKGLMMVNIDPSQIDQMLANLCVNARDAITNIGQITIKTDNFTFDEAYCSAHVGSVSGEYVLLLVSDDGCGMDKETQANIYDPFFTTKEQGKGTGLGLATLYGIVKQNSGFIDVYSEPGLGTTFRIYLPRHTGKTSQMVKTDADKPDVQGHETILLVEDEHSILRMTTMMLERLGYTVVATSSPGEAIRLVGEYTDPIHLLMTDVVMPEMNGRDLSKKILTIYPNINRLFMSGYTADVIAHHGVLNKGVNFIQKPFSQKDLAAKVRETLDNAEFPFGGNLC